MHASCGQTSRSAFCPALSPQSFRQKSTCVHHFPPLGPNPYTRKVAATAAAAVAAISASNTSAVVSGDGLEGGTLFARDVTSASPAGVAHPIPFEPRKTAKGRLIISRGSMETAFAAVCKAYVPRPGQPMSRTREEVNALAQVGLCVCLCLRNEERES